MFDAHCPSCDRRHLIFAGQIRGMRQTADRTVLDYQCWCGALSTWTAVRTSDDVAADTRRDTRQLSLAG